MVLRHVALLHQRLSTCRAASIRWTSRRSRTDDTSNQAYGGTYTYDNNGRVTWAITDKQKLTGWYAYQYKVDPHWLIQIFNPSPEAARITTWHTQLSTMKWTYTRHEQAAVRSRRDGRCQSRHDQGGSRSGRQCPSRERWRRAASRSWSRRPGLTYRAPTGFDFDDRLPSPVVQRLGELRDRLAQRQDRVRDAARPLLAR